MLILGYILAGVGCVACLVGEIWMLRIALRLGPAWFISCLILAPLTWFALLAFDFKAAARPFAFAFFGFVAAGVGGLMAGIN